MKKDKDKDDKREHQGDDVSPEIVVRMAVVTWAERKGMLPMFGAGSGGAFATAAPLNPAYWKFAATKAFKRWEDNTETSEVDFDAAVLEMLRQDVR